jgi:hypothetical protein
MALTKSELLLAADTAEKWPKGRAYQWLKNLPVGPVSAAERIVAGTSKVEDG